MEKDKPQYIFVYGTLMKKYQGPKPYRMEGLGKYVGDARIPGKLYEIEGYPGLVKSQEPNFSVLGEVYKLYDPENSLPKLDQYEMCSPEFPEPHEYRREITTIALNGKTTQAWVYYYNHWVSEKKLIPSGDYASL